MTMIRTDQLMTKTEIKLEAQLRLLDNGDGGFVSLEENHIERIEQSQRMGIENAEDIIEKTNAESVLAEMQIQFGRMMKLFGFVEFQGSH